MPEIISLLVRYRYQNREYRYLPIDTCDVTYRYCLLRRHLNYGGENFKYYLTLLTRSSSLIGVQR
jgi:hypothetical protein